MKKITAVGLAIMALLSLPCCTEKPAKSIQTSPWKSENPVSDSLMLELDKEFESDEPRGDRIVQLAREVEKLGKLNSDTPTIARFHYIQTRYYKNFDIDTLALSTLKLALERVDSVKYPYDYARIRQLYASKLYPDPADEIRMHKENLETYMAAHDSMKVSETYNAMSVIYKRFYDYDTAMDFYNKARLYLKDGQNYPIFVNDLNRALLYNDKLDMKDSARKIFQKLLKNPARYEHPKINCLILENNYRFTGDVGYLWEAYEAEKNMDLHETYPYNSALTAAFLTDHFLRQGRLDSAGIFASEARRTMPSITMQNIEIPEALSHYYTAVGKPDSVAFFSHKKDSVMAVHKALRSSEKIQRMKNNEQIASLNRVMKSEKENGYVNLVISIFVVILITLLLTMTIIWRFKKTHSIEKEALRDSLDIKSRELGVIQMQVAEAGGDWDRFSMLFGQVNPRFIDTLTSEYPSLTSGDIRLCCLTLLGVETKEIARMMSILPDSVKKNRKRMRFKLGLKPDESLDAFLRSIAAKARSSR